MKPFAPPLRKRVVGMFGVTLLASLLSPPLFGAGVIIRLAGEPSSEGGRYNRGLAEEWAQKTGNKVEYIFRPSADSSVALQVYNQYWASKSPDVDVYQIDVIWQGIAAPHAVDLKNITAKTKSRPISPGSLRTIRLAESSSPSLCIPMPGFFIIGGTS